MMNIWEKLRIRILALTFISAVLIVGKAIFIPSPYQAKKTTFDFPQKVPLARWQLSASQSLANPNYPQSSELVSQWRYQYQQKGSLIDIEMHYINGLLNASENIQNSVYKGSFNSSILRQREGIGYYSLGVDRNQRAYLFTCINSQGDATVTASQSLKNDYLHDIRPDRLKLALLGQSPLLDKRCLFTYMSIPLQNSSPETAYQVLENTFFEWYKWWINNYPKI